MLDVKLSIIHTAFQTDETKLTKKLTCKVFVTNTHVLIKCDNNIVNFDILQQLQQIQAKLKF